jgi:4-amino-4-deoxy-L-arabinose transferase-like glycosyltransferase
MTGFIDKYNTTTNKNFIFYTFFAGYAAFIIYLCSYLNIWVDEVYTLDTTSYNLRGVIKQSYDFEAQPPLYFILLSLWRTINSSIFFARLFSALSVAAAAFVFCKLVKLISQKECSRWFIILFLLNPFTVWAGTEIRLYAFLLLLSLTSLYYFFRFYISGQNKYLVIFVFTGIAGIYSQHLYVFLLASLGITIFIFKGWKTFFKFSLYLLPVALLFLVNMLYASNPMKLTSVASFNISFTQRLMAVFHAPQDLVMAAHIMPFTKMVRWGFILPLIIFTAYAFIKGYKKNTAKNELYFQGINIILLAAFLLLVFIGVFFSITGIDYTHRYFAIGFPLLVAVFLLFDIYPLPKRNFIFLAVAAIYISALIAKYQYPVKDFDAKSLAGHLEKNANKDEPIMFYEKVMVLPFKYYYTAPNPIIALPDSVKFDSTYFEKIKDTVQLKQSIERINTASSSYLLVTNRNEVFFKEDGDLKMLNSYLPRHYSITMDTLFYGYNKTYPIRIRRLQKK